MPDPTPTTLPTEPTDEAARGIVDVIDGFVAQNVVVNKNRIMQEYPDQDGAIRAGKVYDYKFTFSLNVYAEGDDRDTAPFDDGDVVQFRGEYWKIDDCEKTDTYNDTVKWKVTGHRHVKGSDTTKKYPTAPSGASGT